MCCIRPDGVGTVTHEERDKFQDIKERLRVHLEFQITNFRFLNLNFFLKNFLNIDPCVIDPVFLLEDRKVLSKQLYLLWKEYVLFIQRRDTWSDNNFWLFFQVLMKDIMTPVPVDEVRAVIKKCLENAALINYNKLASEAKVEG